MPIQIISSQDAIKYAFQSSASWPAGIRDKRLIPFPSPKISRSFSLGVNDSVYCMGSCFARNIELTLTNLGINCLSSQANNHHAKKGWKDNNFLIRYNPYSMLNELEWALDPQATFPESAFLQINEKLWMDPHNHTHYNYHSLQITKELREIVTNNVKKIKDSSVFIITLGLIEVWYDEELKLYTNLMPDRSFMEKHPNRFTLHVMKYAEVIDVLEKIYSLLMKYIGKELKILLSISPVPLAKTFRNHDVMIANMYSKSILRSAAEEFVASYDNINYFPSYESIMMSNRKDAWDCDLRHVSADAVRFNVIRMLKEYCNPNEMQVPLYRRRTKLRQFIGKKFGAIRILKYFRDKFRKKVVAFTKG